MHSGKQLPNLQHGAPYQWGHMGGCNCGNLAQELTKLDKDQIHRYAMQRHGDWNEQAEDYCSTSQMPIDLLINELLNAGLMLEDLKHLERLDDRAVLLRFPVGQRYSQAQCTGGCHRLYECLG